MLALRILTLPIAMAAFVALYIVANKAPHAMEMAGVLFWTSLPILGAIATIKRVWRRSIKDSKY